MLKFISSSKLALVLVALVILFSLAGAILPQEGMFEERDIAAWQKNNPIATTLLRPLGLFHVFHSIPFLVIIFLLALNTLTCTILRLIDQGGFAALKSKGSMHTWGFLLLHLSLIGLFAGGAVSVAFSLDGYIVLTEGQTFKELRPHYIRLATGPLRPAGHKGFEATLKEVKTVFHKDKPGVPLAVTSRLRFPGQNEPVEVKINYPYAHDGMAFTQDKTGYSPRLLIRETQSGRALTHSFVALKTFGGGPTREYRDFLPLRPLMEKNQRLILTFYPDYKHEDGKLIKTGEQPVNPLILAELKDEKDTLLAQAEITLNGSGTVGDYTLGFTGFRRWSSFRVMDDPGYDIVWVSLLLCLVGIVLRYIPDLREWF